MASVDSPHNHDKARNWADLFQPKVGHSFPEWLRQRDKTRSAVLVVLGIVSTAAGLATLGIATNRTKNLNSGNPKIAQLTRESVLTQEENHTTPFSLYENPDGYYPQQTNLGRKENLAETALTEISGTPYAVRFIDTHCCGIPRNAQSTDICDASGGDLVVYENKWNEESGKKEWTPVTHRDGTNAFIVFQFLGTEGSRGIMSMPPQVLAALQEAAQEDPNGQSQLTPVGPEDILALLEQRYALAKTTEGFSKDVDEQFNIAVLAAFLKGRREYPTNSPNSSLASAN